MVGETREVIALARRFNDEVARPLALALDRETQQDPGFMPQALVEEANRRGFYTLWVPRMFGGRGYNLPSISYFAEEVSSACTGIANVIGVHYLGVAGLIASANPALANRVLREVAEGERRGHPCLVALAVTEPLAGTDVEEVELLEKGHVTCHARRVEGGYRVTGTKVFISMGHLSTWTVLYAYTDTKRPAESTLGMVVKAGAPGFTLGRHEDKMGQRVCSASVLEFDDCFVPDDQVLFDARAVGRLVGRPAREVGQRYIDYVLSATRPGVCAFGTGAARGALEAALRFAADTEVDGAALIGREWVQSLLAEMHKNVVLGRLAYQEANHASGLRGLYRLLQSPAIFHALRLLPEVWFERVLPPLFGRPALATLMAKLLYGGDHAEDQRCCSGWASLAKVAGTDMGVKNAQLALELMGQAGLRQDRGVEKILRDAKLLQIYEGTNQLNRLNLFKCLLASEAPGAVPFSDVPWGG
jgi:alkylation response protein AidB-like acyl-CoA dehydrogenase